MNFLKKYLSRKFLATVAFGGVVPVLFHALGLSDQVIISSMGLAALYAGANAMSKKAGSE